MSNSLKFVGLLNAVKGFSGKHSFKYWFLLTMDLQCFACIVCIEGSLGSYLIANNGLLFFFVFFFDLIRASFLGIDVALFRAESIILSG